jgi:hypothetical protein
MILLYNTFFYIEALYAEGNLLESREVKKEDKIYVIIVVIKHLLE